jgi:hypothetical protein
MRALGDLLAAGQAELLWVSSAREPPSLAAGVEESSGFRLLRAAPGTPVPRLRSLGLAASRGEVVALSEDFCVPRRGWAEALLAIHRPGGPLAAGGPVDRGEGSRGDWALTLAEYGRFFSAGNGTVADLPGVNVSYRREDLRDLLGGWPEFFEEWFVHAGLRDRSADLHWCPLAVVEDRSRRPFRDAVAGMLRHGRLFGATRVTGRGPGFRAWRLLLAPLAPLPQLTRIVRAVARTRRRRELLRCAPHLLALLGAFALGEALGVVAGPGRSRERWT